MTDKQTYLIDMVLKHEGGYVNIAADKGGETYCGIARKYHPTWSGWKAIDDYKKVHGPIKRGFKITNNTELNKAVYQFYLDKFYIPAKIDSIDNMLIAGHLFCHAVNAGISNGVKVLQKTLTNVYRKTIIVDGKIGPYTLSHANDKRYTNAIIEEFIKQRKAYYTNIVNRNPSQQVFLKGWFNRVDSTTIACKDK